MTIRTATRGDLEAILTLYTFLHDNPFPVMDERVLSVWDEIMGDKNHHILLGFEGETLVSSCVVVVIPNLTRGQHPYALVENVVTHPDFRKRGFATQILRAVRDIATENRCYKIMLMTGSKEQATLDFYRNAGYSPDVKTAFHQWLEI